MRSDFATSVIVNICIVCGALAGISSAGISSLRAATLADRDVAATYTVGTLETVRPGTEGKLRLKEDEVSFVPSLSKSSASSKSSALANASASVETEMHTLYSQIQNVDLGPKMILPSSSPAYKAWKANKNGLDRPAHRVLIIQFTARTGSQQDSSHEDSSQATRQGDASKGLNQSLNLGSSANPTTGSQSSAHQDQDVQTMAFELEEWSAIQMSTLIEKRSDRGPRATVGDAWWGDGFWKTKRNGNAVNPDALDSEPPK
jgi:hypothetical protein